LLIFQPIRLSECTWECCWCQLRKYPHLCHKKVDEAWGSVTGPFITINVVIFLYHRETGNILDIIKRSNDFAFNKGGC
jgi:hypothetical protein